MSFILDALKKSELERQRQTVPGLMHVAPLERRARLRLWVVALAVLLGVNLAVLLIVLLRGTPSSTHAVAGIGPPLAGPPLASAPAGSPPGAGSPGAPAPSPPAAPAEAPATLAPRAVEAPPAVPPARAAKHFSPMDATPVYAPEISADRDAAAASARSDRAGEAGGSAPAPGRSAAALGSASPARTTRARDPVLTGEEDKADEEVLPTIGEIDLSGQPALPDLHLDVHVFAAKPADRFVYIDMRKYREGATLADGLTLERIRRDGVVLNYHGLRFVLPRQQ